jgi:pSer/pThr/pTyr-binding forkhead associated (FHA) protein
VPYIVIKSNGQEIERRELEIGIVIGRAPDCDITVRDILLSRRHCRLSPCDDGWMIQDLQSKNGTVFNGERLRVPRLLADNDVVRFGRSKIIYHAGVMDDDFGESLLSPARPHTPGDSLAGTLSGFQLLLPGEGEIPEDGPCPQPRPKNPATYDGEEIQAMLTAIASSSWDSVYAEARQPLRGGGASDSDDPSFEAMNQPRKRVRPSSPTDFSLQVNQPDPVAVAPPPPAKPKRAARRFRVSVHAVVGVIWVGFLIVISTSRKPLAHGSTPPAIAAAAQAPSDPEILKAADEELLDSRQQPATPAPPKLQFTTAGAKQAATATALYLPFIW